MRRLRRGHGFFPLAAIAGLTALVAISLITRLPRWGFAGVRGPPSCKPSSSTRAGSTAVAEAPPASPPSTLAPTAASLSLPTWRRVVGDTKAAVGWPLRFLKLSQITREVIDDVRNSAGSAKRGTSTASKTLKAFIPTYMRSHVIARTEPEDYRELLNTTLRLFLDSFSGDPYPFEPYHEAIRGPQLDHYRWGNDFFRSMIKYRGSRVEGLEHVMAIKEHIASGGNVVLLANHQTEADPQVLSILLELEGHEELAEQCIFLAGHKVTTDPLAVPFSMGRNLLTIYSKKYLDQYDDEEKEEKSAHNRATVVELQRLLNEGGHIFWVAPSGGRDRRSAETGQFEPAAFDPQSVGLFQLLAQKAEKASKKKTVFFPLAMWTNRLVPPPDGASSTVGEARSAARAPVGLNFGESMDPAALGGRKKFPEAAERFVRELYVKLDSLMRR